MNAADPKPNQHILIIDDNPTIHEDFRKILCPGNHNRPGVKRLAAALFDQAQPAVQTTSFELDSAYQGNEGLEMVKRALAEDRPYAMAFVDMRMPPGWDGIETIQRIWEVQPDLQIVICTAYSDHSWEEINGKLGKSDSLLILKKPFDNVEVLQFAHALCNKWVVTSEAKFRLDNLECLVETRTLELVRANEQLRSELERRTEAEKVLRESEQALLRSEKKFRCLFETTRDAIMTLEPPSWKFTTANPAAVRLFGTRNEGSLVALEPWTLSPDRQPDGGVSADKAREMIETALREGTNFFEWTHRRVGGEEFSADVLLTQMEREGKVILQATVRDITRRKQAEAALVTQAVRYKTLMDLSGDSIYLLDENGELVEANVAFYRGLGYTAAEMKGMNVADWEVRGTLDGQQERMLTFADHSPVFETRHRRKDGSVFDVEARVTNIRIEGKSVLCCATRDITERKRAEETTRRLASIVESSNDAIIGESLEGTVTSWNRAAENIFAYSAAEMIGRSMTVLLPPDRATEERDILDHTTRGDSVNHLETRRVRKDGVQIDVVETVSPIKDAQGRIVGASKIARDITRRRRAEVELEHTHNKLLAVSRQAGIAEFATGVLHNVGNVLNSVNVASACVSDSLKKSKTASLAKVVALMRQHEADLGTFFTHDPKGKLLPEYLAKLANHLSGEQAAALEELGQLQKNIEHIKSIITVQQDSAKLSHSREALKPAAMVEDALKLNANGLRNSGIHVIREFNEIPSVMAEKHKVLQILVNLVRNAMQALEGPNTADRRLTIRVCQESGRARIAVADNGVGIQPENLSQIFTHGFTTKRDGHGFGLHSAALAAKEMGGSLSVHSDGPAHGATFALELPLAS
jgi:PAS domain S-box-containing protein